MRETELRRLSSVRRHRRSPRGTFLLRLAPEEEEEEEELLLRLRRSALSKPGRPLDRSTKRSSSSSKPLAASPSTPGLGLSRRRCGGGSSRPEGSRAAGASSRGSRRPATGPTRSTGSRSTR